MSGAFNWPRSASMPPSQLSSCTGMPVAAVNGDASTCDQGVLRRLAARDDRQVARQGGGSACGEQRHGDEQRAGGHGQGVRAPDVRRTLQSTARIGNAPFAAKAGLTAEDRADCEISLGGGDLLAAVPAHALHLDEAALAVDQSAGAGDRHDLAELLAFHLGEGAGDALAALEQEQFLPVQRGPGAGGRVDSRGSGCR